MVLPGVRSQFTAIYGVFMLLEIFEVRSDCAGSHAETLWLARALASTAPRSDCGAVRSRAEFLDLVVTFRGRRKGKLASW